MEIDLFRERNHNMQRGGKHQQGKAKRIKRIKRFSCNLPARKIMYVTQSCKLTTVLDLHSKT